MSPTKKKKAPAKTASKVIAAKEKKVCPNCGNPVPATGESKNVCVTCRVTVD